MAAPTSPVQICNLALDRLGIAPITSIDTPTTDTEDICARHYDSTRQEMLRRFVFNFSRKYLILTKSATETPAFGFTSAFELPNDFIRLLALGDVTLDANLDPHLYDLSNGFIYTSNASSTDGNSLNLWYIFDAKTVSKFDPLFTRLFVLHLAANMAYKFTLKPSLINGIRQDAADAALAAAAVAGQEKPPRRIQRSKLRDVRRRGGLLRDNTRV